MQNGITAESLVWAAQPAPSICVNLHILWLEAYSLHFWSEMAFIFAKNDSSFHLILRWGHVESFEPA